MIDSIVKSGSCTGCHACYSACQKNCITMVPDAGGFLYPKCDIDLCNKCNICVSVCPALKNKKVKEETRAFAAQCLDKEILRESSSGGVFSLLAQYILKNGGVVFGAALTDNFREVHHIFITHENDIKKLRGSKYVQSFIKDTYKHVKNFLEEGILVLFSGTPCQIMGLKCFLRKEYDMLVTVDVLCHGVASPKMWGKYVDYRMKESGEKPIKISFREKKYGWRKYSMCFEFAQKTYRNTVDKDPYLQGFLRHPYLRKSCYKCIYKDFERNSDVTLGDFWSIGNYINNIDDCGMSLVITHSLKGNMLLTSIRQEFKIWEIKDVKSIKNGAINHTAFYNYARNGLMKNIDKMSFEELEKRYFSNSFHCKIVRVISRKMHSEKG